jgi:hypothetical protein
MVCAKFEYRRLLGITQENHTISGRNAGNPVDIRTGHLLDKNQQLCDLSQFAIRHPDIRVKHGPI